MGNGTAESRTLDPGPQPGVPGGGYQVSLWTDEDPPGTRFLREERRRTPSDRDMGTLPFAFRVPGFGSFFVLP